MPLWQTTVERHLENIETYYLENSAVQEEMAVKKLIDQFVTSLETPGRDPLHRLDVVEWREQFTEVASAHRTGELGSVIRAISASEHLPSERPMIGLGVVTLISTLVDCRTQFSTAPIEEAVTPLIKTIETTEDVGVARENLAVATERTADVARTTGLAAKSVNTVSEFEFPHPETSTEEVQTAIQDALERNEEDRIRTLGQQVVRSANCEWTQSDLTAFADKKKLVNRSNDCSNRSGVSSGTKRQP